MDDRIAILETMTDGKLYIENVRAYFNIPRGNAEFLCEQGVREDLFKRKVGLLCGNSDCKRVLVEADTRDEFPKQVNCENCEDLDEDQFEFQSRQLERVIFYTLSKHGT